MASSIRSLKMQAGLVTAAVFAVGVLAAGLLSYAAMSRTLDEAHRERLLAGANAGLEALGGVGNRMSVYADIFARHPELITTIEKADSAGFEAFAVREFKAVHAVDPALATFEITDAKGVVIMRGHNPAKRGDDKSAQPQIRDVLSGKSARGLTVSPATGEAAEDSVRPIMTGDKVIGTLKVGSYFNHASATELKDRTGFDIVFMSRGKASSSTFGKDAQIPIPDDGVKAASLGTPALAHLGKATSRTPSMYVDEKSDEAIVLAKRLNKGRQLPAEVVEGRASPKGNSR